MQLRHISGPLLDTQADLWTFCVFSDSPGDDATFRAVDDKLGGVLSNIAKQQEFSGKRDQAMSVMTRGELATERVVVLGAGSRNAFQLASLRDLAAVAAQLGNRVGARTVCFQLPPIADEDHAAAAQFAAEGAILGTYRFDKYRSEKKRKSLRTFGVRTASADKPAAAASRALKAALKRAQITADATCRARDYINEPAAFMTPSQLADEARALAKEHGLTVKILGRAACERLGMGMFLAVGQGSDQEPKLIHLTYKPKKKPKKRIALIGKGVMFDSGGYSLKPSGAMEDMKVDMSGAAAVIASMSAIAELGSPHEVHGIAACCENMVSGRAYKLGDVLKSMDGTTVEINNTDAEGRLTLGDALTYARTKVKPDEMFDFATLTGACMVALGPHTAGVMSANEELVAAWLDAAGRAGEDMWRLPLIDRLREQLKSNIADMRNTGERYGGAITAGLFLKRFAKKVPWVHVDIAGPASATRARGAVTRGGVGFGVASIVEYVTRG